MSDYQVSLEVVLDDRPSKKRKKRPSRAPKKPTAEDSDAEWPNPETMVMPSKRKRKVSVVLKDDPGSKALENI